MSRGWKMGHLCITSLVYKHSSTHLIYLNSYAKSSQINGGQPNSRQINGGLTPPHQHVSSAEFLPQGPTPDSFIRIKSGTLHQGEEGILWREAYHPASTAARNQVHVGAPSDLDWDPRFRGLGPASDALKPALPAPRAKCTTSCLKAFMAAWVHLKEKK